MSLDAARIWLPAISSQQHQASLLLDAANGNNTDCFVAPPDLEVPMINSLVSCLAREHLKLDEQILQLTLVATSPPIRTTMKLVRTRGRASSGISGRICKSKTSSSSRGARHIMDCGRSWRNARERAPGDAQVTSRARVLRRTSRNPWRFPRPREFC